MAENIQAAIDRHGIGFGVTALDLAYNIKVVLQGALFVAKAKGDPAIARTSVIHLKRYVEIAFGVARNPRQETQHGDNG